MNMNVVVIIHVQVVTIQYMSKHMFYILRWLNVLMGCGVIVYGQCISIVEFHCP